MVSTKQFLDDFALALADLPDGCAAIGIGMVRNSENSLRVRAVSNIVTADIALQLVGYMLWRGCASNFGKEFEILLDKFKELTVIDPTKH